MDASLSVWVGKRREALKKSRATLELVAGYSEGDWFALRELIGDDFESGLRAEVIARGRTHAEIEVAIQRRLRDLPPVRRGTSTYTAPYSLGVEVAVLREMLGKPAYREPKTTTEVLF